MHARASDDEKKDDARATIEALAEPRPGQVYQHYKGGIYSIVAVSFMEDTLEIIVTYSSNLKGGCTTRTLANFVELVEIIHEDNIHSYETPRFRRVNR